MDSTMLSNDLTEQLKGDIARIEDQIRALKRDCREILLKIDESESYAKNATEVLQSLSDAINTLKSINKEQIQNLSFLGEIKSEQSNLKNDLSNFGTSIRGDIDSISLRVASEVRSWVIAAVVVSVVTVGIFIGILAYLQSLKGTSQTVTQPQVFFLPAPPVTSSAIVPPAAPVPPGKP